LEYLVLNLAFRACTAFETGEVNLIS